MVLFEKQFGKESSIVSVVRTSSCHTTSILYSTLYQIKDFTLSYLSIGNNETRICTHQRANNISHHTHYEYQSRRPKALSKATNRSDVKTRHPSPSAERRRQRVTEKLNGSGCVGRRRQGPLLRRTSRGISLSPQRRPKIPRDETRLVPDISDGEAANMLTVGFRYSCPNNIVVL